MTQGSCPIPNNYTSTPGTYTFTLRAEGPGGPSVTQTTQFTVTQTGGSGGCDQNQLSASFKVNGVNTVNITSGQSATLSWDVKPAGATVAITGVGTGLQLNSTQVVQPTKCTTYILSASCGTKTITQEVNVHVQPTVTVTCSQTEIELGQTVNGKWQVTPTTANVNVMWAPANDPSKGGKRTGVNPDSSLNFTPDVVDNNYQFTAYASTTGGTCTHVGQKACTIKVKQPTLIIESFTANGYSNSISITKGQSINFQWTVKGCTNQTQVSFGTANSPGLVPGTCTALKLQGGRGLSPIVSGNYVVQAVDAGNTASKTISVTVTEPPPKVQFWATASLVRTNQSFNLCWSISPQGSATSAKIGLVGGPTYPVPPQDGCYTASMPTRGTYTFTFQAGNNVGQDTKTVTVLVEELTPVEKKIVDDPTKKILD